MLSLNKINVDIGPVGILKKASLSLSQGEMVGLIGRNGAGKTTLLKTIMGILKTKSGEIAFENEDLVTLPSLPEPIIESSSDCETFSFFAIFFTSGE